MKAALGLAIVVLVVVLWLHSESRRVARKVEIAFKGRGHLSDEEFFETYYQGSGIPIDIVKGVRGVLAEALHEDVSRVIPTDDFSGNLNFLLDAEPETDVAIVEGLETRFDIRISKQEAERTRTVDDIIHLVHAKVLSK